MSVLRTVLVLLLVGTVAGCGAVRRPRQTPPRKPKELGPIEIVWSDPGSVVEGFFDAKKRGDWRKAFECCDFKERLGAEEAKRIRAEWKKEAHDWPAMHERSQWYIAGVAIQDNLAQVSVKHIRWVGPGMHDTAITGFEELVKLYGDRWKISDFELEFVPKE